MIDSESPAPSALVRCVWAGTDPLMIDYHDREWGVPIHDDRRLFELLMLEGAQAGLSWSTILKKREGYRTAFHGFDPVTIASFGPEEVDTLLANPAIVRNRLKIAAVIAGARAVLEFGGDPGNFSRHLWSFVGGHPIQNSWDTSQHLPAMTDESKAMSQDLRKRGFKFVGPTICYAFMQSAGMVNDHAVTCFRHAELAADSA
jgi:DNA-3-methyladenine glycosylase I